MQAAGKKKRVTVPLTNGSVQQSPQHEAVRPRTPNLTGVWIKVFELPLQYSAVLFAQQMHARLVSSLAFTALYLLCRIKQHQTTWSRPSH